MRHLAPELQEKLRSIQMGDLITWVNDQGVKCRDEVTGWTSHLHRDGQQRIDREPVPCVQVGLTRVRTVPLSWVISRQRVAGSGQGIVRWPA